MTKQRQTSDAPARLSVYDLWMLGFSGHFQWKCSSARIAQQFLQLCSDNHLDVGSGGICYLQHYQPDDIRRLALLDSNPANLNLASQAMAHLNPEIYCSCILSPPDLHMAKFRSVSLNFLLHRLPGEMAEKQLAFQHLRSLMLPGAVIFGSTMLGKEQKLNFSASQLLAHYNKQKIFSNSGDDEAALHLALSACFSRVNVHVAGSIALFSARLI